jgi:hypothetical protein
VVIASIAAAVSTGHLGSLHRRHCSKGNVDWFVVDLCLRRGSAKRP